MRKLKFFLACLFIVSVSLVSAQTKVVSGKVISAKDGKAIVGAKVLVVGTKKGVITDINGQYRFIVKASVKRLSVESMGMKKIKVPAKENQIVKLEEQTSDLNEVVVYGYGTRKKESVSGSLVSVGKEKLKDLATMNFENALQGSASGVQVVSSSGRPGASSSVMVRGVGSISAGSNPLYIIDGVQSSSGDYTSLNTSDIENITVLKDASATALYGARAGNGVILVTTKRGTTSDRAKITYKGTYGYNQRANKGPEQMNSKQKLDYEEYVFGKTRTDAEKEALSKVDTKWIDLLTRNTNSQSHELSFRGGTQEIKYFVSGGFQKADGIILGSDYKRFTSKMNLDYMATENLKMGVNILGKFSKSNRSTTADEGYNANVFNPVFRSYLENPYVAAYRADGSYTTTQDGLKWANPIEELELNRDQRNHLKITSNVFAEYKLFKYVKARTSLGVDFSETFRNRYISPKSVWGKDTKGTVTNSFGRGTRLMNTNTLTFDKDFDDHSLKVLLGHEYTDYFYHNFSASGKILPNDINDVLDVTADPESVGGNESGYAFLSFFGAVNYDYLDKYYVDASLRYDASSRFGTEERWAPFWSAGFMWNVLNEDFMSDFESLSTLKIKTSYGTMGNADIGYYNSLATYAVGGTYNDNSAGYLSAPGNPHLTWEKINMFDAGIDIGLFERINLSLGYYMKSTSSMLYDVPFSMTSGFSSGWANIGKIENKGLEAKLGVKVIDGEQLSWDLEGVVGYNQNKVLELFDEESNKVGLPDGGNSTILKVGYSYGTRYAVRYLGANPVDGTALYLDKNGNVTSEYKESNAVALEGKSWIPKWSGGFSSVTKYKGFTLRADFSFLADYWVLNNTRFFNENINFAQYGQSTAVLDYWKKPGDITQFTDPKKGITAKFDDRFIEDASFLRLKFLVFSYDFPTKLVKRTNLLQSTRLFVSGSNLLTFTRYKGFDPEFLGPWEVGAYPSVRQFQFGVELGL